MDWIFPRKIGHLELSHMIIISVADIIFIYVVRSARSVSDVSTRVVFI